MRDPKRIPEVLEAIRKAWEASPDLRLGQLIMNLAGTDLMAFYIEDGALAARAEVFLKTTRGHHDRSA